MNYETIELEKEGGVATITLNRPDKLNAMCPDLMIDLSNVIEDIQHDEAVRAVVLTGAGRAFCAGGDVKDLLSQATDPVEMMDRSMEGAKLVAAMRNIPKPMIAAVNGPAVGAGCNLALACDIIIAAENASFSMAFISLGLHPDTGGIYFLTRLVGVARACELVFTGKAIGAQEAERIGLINQVVPAEQLESTVSELAGRLAKGPSKAIAMAKATIYQGLTMDMNSVLEAEVRAMSLSIATEDAKEGISAFLERRKPIFKGK